MSKHHKLFEWPVRVYFQDTDAGGVVYHANYVNFMERARTEWLRSFGYSNAGMMMELGVMFVVRSIKLDYLKPAKLDDMLMVTAQVKEIGRSRLNMVQTVTRDGVLLTEGEVHLVCVKADSFKPVSVPEIMRKQWS
ncbi:MAG: tol-pal system-associated acyl-CoA thioesterase [Gallionellaceae bacterium]